MEQEKSAAILTIKDANNMTPKGRKQVAEWLKEEAKNLIKHGKDYNKRFTARYIYK